MFYPYLPTFEPLYRYNAWPIPAKKIDRNNHRRKYYEMKVLEMIQVCKDGIFTTFTIVMAGDITNNDNYNGK